MQMNELLGTWKLKSFEVIAEDNSKTSWGEDVSGLIIYSPYGYMSVSMNRKLVNEDLKTIFYSSRSYSGTYAVKDGKVYHHISNCNDPARIGKTMVRSYSIKDRTLELRTAEQDFGKSEMDQLTGTGLLIWEKIGPEETP